MWLIIPIVGLTIVGTFSTCTSASCRQECFILVIRVIKYEMSRVLEGVMVTFLESAKEF